jgi:hypothetical protein
MGRFDIKNEESVLSSSMDDVKEFSKRLYSIKGKISLSEDHVVDRLKSMYMNTKTNMVHSREVASYMQTRPSLIESTDNNIGQDSSSEIEAQI